ncbi:MAG: hypothetical protein ACT4QA_20135 [Panacagrimonas sp.]
METYSLAGVVQTVVDEFGVGWTYTYLSNHRPDRVTHTSGRYVAFTWRSDNRVTTELPFVFRLPTGRTYAALDC